MMSLVLVFILFLVPSARSSADNKKYHALHFGTTTSDYLEFNYDMTPFQNQFSICSWVKKVSTSASQPTVFNYWTSSQSWEIRITSNGYYTYVFGNGGLNTVKSKFTHAAGVWFSYCITWSRSSGTAKLYLDGELAGTAQMPDRSLHTGGKLMFNRLSTSYYTGSDYVFGGQVYNFNVYSRELSGVETGSLAKEGLCGDVGKHDESRVLRWEDILDRSRSGSVVEIDTGCEKVAEMRQTLTDLLSETKLRLAATESKLEKVSGELNQTKQDLEHLQERTKQDLEHLQEQLEASQEQLEASQEQLEASQGQLQASQGDLEETRDLLDVRTAQNGETQAKLGMCLSALSSSRKFENISRWDVLYTAPYFNKVFTEESYQQLTSSWHMLRKFVGANITEGIVSHFQHYHNEGECNALEQLLSPDMLKQFVGVRLTDGMVDHFRAKHEESPCNDTTGS